MGRDSQKSVRREGQYLQRENKELHNTPHNFRQENQHENLTGTLSEGDLRIRLRAFPKDAQSWYLLGKLLRTGSKLRPAEDALRTAISINPSPPHFWLELAKVLDDLGASSEATAIRQRIVAKAKELDVSSLQAALKASKKESSLVAVSPCISCQHYTYYGCSKKGHCLKLKEWRDSVLHPK
jgi:cytochrome c-type biogenesis protein CcmH/NrfG